MLYEIVIEQNEMARFLELQCGRNSMLVRSVSIEI